MKMPKSLRVAASGAVVASLLRPFCQEVQSQSTIDALTFGPGIHDVGYLGAATGWTFVPTTDLRVVAVGSLPMQSSLEVSFWSGTNQILATFSIPVQPSDGNDLVYQPVDGPTLKAGAAYAVSTLSPVLPVEIFSRQGAGGGATFATSPFITQFGNFQVSTNNLWSPLPGSTNNSDWLFLGPTFRFQVLRQLSLYETSTNLMLTWPTQSVVFAVQQSVDVTAGHWATLTNDLVIVGSNNQIALPKQTKTSFFRLISQ
jgi:hypothetical protein